MKYLSSAASGIAGLLIAVLVLVTASSVFMRYVVGSPFQWTEEFSGLLMIWIVMIAAIACERRDQHLTIDFIVKALPPRGNRLVTVVIACVSVGFLVFMAYQAWILAEGAQFKRTQILRISWFWLDLAVCIGAIGVAIVTLVHIFRPAPAE